MKKLSYLAFFLLTLFALQSQAATSINAQLGWNKNTDTNTINYKVYYGVASRVYTNNFLTGNVTNTVVSNLTENVVYYFTIASVSGVGIESPQGEEIRLGSTNNFSNLVSLPPTNLTPSSAVLSLKVNSVSNLVDAWINYGESTNKATNIISKELIVPVDNTAFFSQNVPSLSPITYYRPFAWLWTNGVCIYGPLMSVQLPVIPPAPTLLNIFKVDFVEK